MAKRGRPKKVTINPDDLKDAEKLKRIVLDLQERSEGQGKEINRLKKIIARPEAKKPQPQELKNEVKNGKARPAEEKPEPEPEEESYLL